RHSRTLDHYLYSINDGELDPAAEMHFDAPLAKPAYVPGRVCVHANDLAAGAGKGHRGGASGPGKSDDQRPRDSERLERRHYSAKFSK
ncbi:MAG: hypothetical protein ACR2OD_08130, partial [Gaiellaceae bacterium]